MSGILSKDWIDDAFPVTLQKSVMLVKTWINLIDLYEKGTANKWLSDSTRKLRGGGDALTSNSIEEDPKIAIFLA